jgi:mono/diheme cytochrome c family protein
MIKNFLIGFIALVIVTVALLGFQGQRRQVPAIEFFSDMKRQDKVKFQKPSSFFADGRAARPPVSGAIPMGYDIPGHPTQNLEVPKDDISSPYGEYSAGTDYYNTGKMSNNWGTGIPLPVSSELLKRGRVVFTINCAVCHGATGQGNGITSKYGLNGIANYHQDKYRTMADGQIFNTLTNGYNTMMGYGDKVTVKDRWAIIAYIRALQRSENAHLADVPEEKRSALEAENKPAEQSATPPQAEKPPEPAPQTAPAPQQQPPAMQPTT